MSHNIFDLLGALNQGSNCRSPDNVKDFWLVGEGLYFLEFGDGHESSGEFYYDSQCWRQTSQQLLACSTQVPASGGLCLAYIPSGIERVTQGNVMQGAQRDFIAIGAGVKARFLKAPKNLPAMAQRWQSGVLFSLQSDPFRMELDFQ